jgi:hypothetical protein
MRPRSVAFRCHRAALFADEELDRLATPLSIHLERAVKARDLSEDGKI